MVEHDIETAKLEIALSKEKLKIDVYDYAQQLSKAKYVKQDIEGRILISNLMSDEWQLLWLSYLQ